MADLENNEKPLRKIADAFKELEATVNSQTPGADVEVAPFSMADLENNEKPLRKIADAFKELEATVNSQTPGADVEVAPFSMADLENNEKPLRKIADAFKELEVTVNSQTPGADVEVAPFSMADLENSEKPLRKIANAFKELEATVNSQTPDVELAPFSRACSLVAPLIRCIGLPFKFAEMDFSAKVNDLAEASKSIGTLQIMIDRDIKDNRVRKAGSHTRNLLRVKRGLALVKAYFEQVLVTDCLKDPASRAYAQIFAPHHGWAIRKAVLAGMYALPTKEQMLSRMNEDETMAWILMQSYVTSSAPVILYIEELYHSRKLGIDW